MATESLLVEPGESLWRLVNYIHLNPVRAGMVPAEELARYRWSSLHWFLGHKKRPAGLEAVS
ncbi:MAG TPA: hypothetical protein VGA17_13210 [Nitrospiraceae bacterium]